MDVCLGVARRDEQTAVACMGCGAGLVIVEPVDVAELRRCWRCGEVFREVEFSSGRRFVRRTGGRSD